MANPSIPCSGSPDITTLSYSILYDISGGVPAITLTNASTVVNPTMLVWWYVITSPSGTPIHSGRLSSPDANHVAWTTLSITPGTWPLLFGNPPCAQVEFSSNSPYICTLYVKDSANNTFNLPIIQTITRPNGSTFNTCGNFGIVQVTLEVKCNDKVIFAQRDANFTYNNNLQPSSQNNEWILTYPPDPTGNQPANATASNTPYVNFPIAYSSEGYTIFLLDYCTYDMGNGANIKVQYKAINPQTWSPGLSFAVLCNINLCKLQCQVQAFYELSKKTCNTVENTTLESKMTRMNFLFNQAIIGIIQPLCGINVPKIVKEIQKIGNLDDNCNCGCTDTGINFSYPLSPGNSTGGCCPSSSNVLDSNTGIAPSNCPANYFPVQVKDPTNTSIIGTANNINDLIAILNSTPAWQAYGVAFPEGYCKVGWFPATGAGTIPNIQVVLITTPILPITIITGNIVILDTVSPPMGCPGAGPYPVRVYDPTGTTIIGIANSISDVVSLLNNYPAWATYGTASVQDNCHVQWQVANTAITIPNIQVDTTTTSTSCVNGSVIYTVTVNDVCATSSTLTPSDFPLNLFIDFGIGGGIISIGNVANITALISALNATATKPASVTFSTGSVFGQVIATNTNCVAYNGVITLTANLGSMDFLFYGGNHDLMEPTQLGVAAVQAIGLANNSLPGQVKGFVSDDPVWHVIHVDKYMICSVQHLTVGQIKVYDMSVPLFPVFVKAVTLPDTGSGTCFSGIPESITVASGGVPITSIYGLYFVTDNPSQMALNAVYVTEPLTGSIWKMDLTPGGAGVTAQFAYQKLLGKCPRVILGNKIYYTQDGDLETAASLVSGVTFGDIVILNLSTFNSGGVSTQNVLSNQEQVWAASYDGTSIINFVGNLGTLVTYTVSTSTIANTYANAFSACLYRLNIKSYLNVIFASSFDFVGKTTGTQRLTITSLPTITRTDFQSFKKPGSSVFNTTHYNPLPLGNCLVAVTTDNWQDPASKTGMLAIYAVDGTFITQIGYDSGDIYNVISFPRIGNYTPNGLT